MVTISLEYILFVVISSAAFAGVLLLIVSRWFDIQGYRYQLDAQRYAIDVLNFILSNSPIVERFENEEPNRFVLSSERLNEYEWDSSNPCCDSSNPPYLRDSWEKTFELLEFDYNLTIIDLVNGEKWTISNLYFNDTECYYEAMRISGFADAPVVISYGKEKHPGKAILTLKRTPLSEIAFSLSEAFMRSEMDETKGYLRGVRIDTSNIKGIKVIGSDRICLKQIIRGSEKWICKYFYKGSKGLSIREELESIDTTDVKCIDIIIQYQYTGDQSQVVVGA